MDDLDNLTDEEYKFIMTDLASHNLSGHVLQIIYSPSQLGKHKTASRTNNRETL